MATIIFYTALAALIYIYFGYPLIISLIARIWPCTARKGAYEPSVTILIAAYNEEKSIGRTIQNKLDLEYPKEKLELIILSDGSTDSTDEIIKSFANQRVRFCKQEPRQGKTAALNFGVQQSQGDIIVFADANSMYESDALRMLVKNFHDPEVGYVTGKMVYTNENGTQIGDGCSAYMRYENYLREQESKVGSLVGVDGGIDAVRKKLYRPMRPDQLPDFVLPLAVVEQGYRVVYEPLALLREETLGKAEDEYRMRVRVSLRAIWALFDMRRLLNPFRYGLFSFQLFSHKWLRYGAFLFMGTAFVASLFAKEYLILITVQLLFYGAALLALVLDRLRFHMGVLYYPYYFMLLNIASAHAFVKFILGQRQVLWAPRKG